MTHADTILRIAVRVAALGSERDAARLREVSILITVWEVKIREFESLQLRLEQCQRERDHIREIDCGLRPRTNTNQEPKGKWVK